MMTSATAVSWLERWVQSRIEHRLGWDGNRMVAGMNGDTARCSFCGMEVPEGQPGRSLDGQTHFFCGRECSLRFDLIGPTAQFRAEVIKRRAKIVDALQADRGSQVITLIHRQELWDVEKKEGYITMEDSEAVLAAIRGAGPDTPIDLIVHTPGGLALAAELIAMALKHHEAHTTVMVPFYAMSGGSMVAVAADEILMGRESILGPLDPQIQGHSAGSLLRLLRRKPVEAISDDKLLQAEHALRSLDQTKEFVKWLLEDKMAKDKREALAVFLTGGYISHETPIVPEVLRSYGLPVRDGLPPRVYELFRTFIFGACERPGATTSHARATPLAPSVLEEAGSPT
ncbi:MAG: hypothetical protein ACE5JE_05395 [Thermoplasmata archaeon]